MRPKIGSTIQIKPILFLYSDYFDGRRLQCCITNDAIETTVIHSIVMRMAMDVFQRVYLLIKMFPLNFVIPAAEKENKLKLKLIKKNTDVFFVSKIFHFIFPVLQINGTISHFLSYIPIV